MRPKSLTYVKDGHYTDFYGIELDAVGLCCTVYAHLQDKNFLGCSAAYYGVTPRETHQMYALYQIYLS